MTLEKGNDNIPETDLTKGNTEELINVVKKLQDQVKQMQTEKLATTGGFTADDIAKLINAAKQDTTKQLDYDAGIEDKDIPLDDFDEKGVVFCAPFAGYCIVDDQRQGHRILLPYNKKFIFFEHQGTRKFQQGKYQATASFATYTSRSKKEQKWIRQHSLFNTMFYENSNKAMSFDIRRAQKLSRIMNTLKDFELHSLIQRAKEYSVPISNDVNALRANLAFEMVDRELASEQSNKSAMLDSTMKEAKLLS